MIYIITALDAEARALVEYYHLKRDFSLPCTLYRNEQMVLLVSGMGKTNAMMSVSALLGWRIPKSEDCMINIGICAAPMSYALNEVLLIHKIIDTDRCYYPDILYPHSLRESSLLCVDSPQSALSEYPVDMESSAIFCAASRFFKLHQMTFIKIVSDHFSPESVTKEGVVQLVRGRLSILDEVCTALQNTQQSNPLFNDEERKKIECFKTYFTKSQGDILEDTLCFSRLKNHNREITLPDELPNAKRERSLLLEELIATLNA